MTVDWRKIEAELKKPFRADEIEWRSGSWRAEPGKRPWLRPLAYVTNRAIMDRLDEVAGMENWHNAFLPGPAGGVLCGITIYGITKWDGAENTEFEPVKGGLSGAEKRAGVPWGIGRYLYWLDSGFAEVSASKVDGWKREHNKSRKEALWWKPPLLPKWALPGGSGRPTIDRGDLLERDDCLAWINKCTDVIRLNQAYLKYERLAGEEDWLGDLQVAVRGRRDELDLNKKGGSNG